MKITSAVILAVVIGFSQASMADERARREAEQLLSIMNMDTLLQQSIERMLQVQLQQNPALAPYKHVMLEFLGRHMSYDQLKGDIVEIYANSFTAGELADINRFYRTPTGQKAIRIMPQLMAQAAQLGASRVQENLGELRQMIAVESKRIQELQAK